MSVKFFLKKALRPVRIFLHKKDVVQEAYVAYLRRLPQRIQVDWLRDGKFIIGKVTAGDDEFVTQGHNAEEFIEMVNDAIFTINDIPENYIDILHKLNTYDPPEKEMKMLQDENILKATFGFSKTEARQLA